MFFFQEGFTYRNFLMDVLGIFFFVVWFWLVIIVFAGLFILCRPRVFDLSGKRHGGAQCAASSAGA